MTARSGIQRLRRLLPALAALALCLAAESIAAAELHDAVRAQDTAQLTRLLKAHPEFVDSRDGEGRSALHLAAATGQFDAVQLLVACGASVNAVDQTGRTPLMVAEAAKHETIAAYLRQHGAGAIDFSKVNDSVLSGFTWCIFAAVALFGLLVFFFIVTKKKKSPDQLLAEEMND